MLIFNTTFHVDQEVVGDFFTFIKNVYIPRSCQSGVLDRPRFAVIHSQHQEKGSNYSLQFHVENIDKLNEWLMKDGEIMQQEIVDRFGQTVMGFVTLLEEIDLDT